MNTLLPKSRRALALLGLAAALPPLFLAPRGCAAAPVPSTPPLRWQPVNEPGCGGAITSIEISPHDPRRVLVAGDMLGAGLSTDGGRTWGPTFGFKSWEMADSTFSPASPSVVWIGTMDGPYRSTDGGVHWTSQRQGMPPSQWGKYTAPIQKVLFDPNDPAHLLAFTGNHRHFADGRCLNFGVVWESHDAGADWARKSVIGADAGGNGGNVMTAAFGAGSSRILYAALSGKGLYKSTDGGATWVARNDGLPGTDAQFLAVHPRDPDTLWVALNGGGVFRSTDGAATWKPADQGLDTVHDVTAIVVASSDPDTLYCGSYSSQAAWKSVDGGTTWAKVLDARTVPPAAMPFPPQATWFAVDPHDPRRVFTLNAVTLFGSADGGRTWKDMTALRPDPAAAPDRWRGRGYSGYVSLNFHWNPYRPSQAVAQAMDDGKLWRSDDGLATWIWAGTSVKHYGGGSDVTFGADGRTLYATFGQWGATNLDDGVAKSTDGGATWAYASVPKDVNVGGQEIPTDIYALPHDSSQVWVLWGNRLYHSADSGASWEHLPVPSGTGAEGTLDHLAADPTHPLTLYVTGHGGVYQSTDGAHFALMPGSPQGNSYGYCSTAITLDPSDPARLYVCNWHKDGDGGLSRYADGVWTKLRADVNISDVAVDPHDPKRLAVCTDDNPWNDTSGASGVWLSEDGGVTWSAQNAGLPMLRAKVIRDSPDGGTLVVGLDGRGFEKLSWPASVHLPAPPPAPASAPAAAATAAPPVVGAPPAPKNLQAVSVAGGVALTWDAVPGASGGYRVKRADVPGGPSHWLISGWQSPNYTDTAAPPGASYTYTVSALGAGGAESADSVPAVTPH